MQATNCRGCMSIEDVSYDKLRETLKMIADCHNLAGHHLHVISAQTLKPEEAIGRPARKDFPLVKGREVMVEAYLNGARGQAFTDIPGNYAGTLAEVLALPLSNNFERAVFVSGLNAVLRYLGWIGATIHCRDQEPEACARHLVDFVRERFGAPRIAFVGFQPAMVDHLARHFEIRVTDMDPDNQGTDKYGVAIEGVDRTARIIRWSDVIFATGSTLVNDTYRAFICDRPLVFYGVTVAAMAYLTGTIHYCHLGH